MKKFIIFSLLFAIPLLFAVLWLEYRLRQVPNPYKYKYEWMQQHADEVETIVLGSSHTFYGIRPEFLECKAFNLANVSQGVEQDLFLLKYWDARYNSLKTVIMPISYFTWFSPLLENDNDAFRCRYYKIYMDCDLYSDLSLNSMEIFDYKSAKKKASKLLYPEEDPGYDEYGWGNTFKLSERRAEEWNDSSEAINSVMRHTAKSWENIPKNKSMLEEMAEYCNSRHVNLILVTTPCWHTYYNILPTKQRNKMRQLTDKLIHDYKLTYLDYLEDSRFSEEDFHDSNHLSDVGAEKFTQILSHDIFTYQETRHTTSQFETPKQ